PALVRAEAPECNAEIVLGLRPVERHALAGSFLEGVAIGGDRLLQPRRPALALAEGPERSAEIVLGLRPVERLLRAWCKRQAIAIDSNGFHQCGVVAKFIALAPQLIRLSQYEFPFLLPIKRCHDAGRFGIFRRRTPVSELKMINPGLLRQ